jgi:hypothetical protein
MAFGSFWSCAAFGINLLVRDLNPLSGAHFWYYLPTASFISFFLSFFLQEIISVSRRPCLSPMYKVSHQYCRKYVSQPHSPHLIISRLWPDCNPHMKNPLPFTNFLPSLTPGLSTDEASKHKKDIRTTQLTYTTYKYITYYSTYCGLRGINSAACHIGTQVTQTKLRSLFQSKKLTDKINKHVRSRSLSFFSVMIMHLMRYERKLWALMRSAHADVIAKCEKVRKLV